MCTLLVCWNGRTPITSSMKFKLKIKFISFKGSTSQRYSEAIFFFSVNRWEEPFDSTVYCVRTDGIYSVLTGTATYGMTRLWDKRMPTPVKVGTVHSRL